MSNVKNIHDYEDRQHSDSNEMRKRYAVGMTLLLKVTR